MSPSSSIAAAPASARLVLIGGGVRSGKSRTALELGLTLGTRRVFVATAQAFDDEMRERIRRHQAERGQSFDTIEAPHALEQVARRLVDYDVVLVDCLTLYLSNQLLAAGDLDAANASTVHAVEQRCMQELKQAVSALQQLDATVLLVTNEVGMGVVPNSRLGRLFRDLAGSANQWVASQAQEVWWCALGIPLRLKPAPMVSGLTTALGAQAPASEEKDNSHVR